jgi:acyl carrier protein
MLIKRTDMDHIEEKLIEIVKKQLTIKNISVNLDSKFKDINADSLDIVEIALKVEEEFDIEIPEDSAENIELVKDVVEIVRQLVKEQQ